MLYFWELGQEKKEKEEDVDKVMYFHLEYVFY